MSKWGSVKFDGLLELEKQVKKLHESEIQRFCEQCANDIANELQRRVKKNTPVGTKPLWAFERAEMDDIVSTGDGVSKREQLEAHWAGYIGGNLRRQWEVQPLAWEGNACVIEVINHAEYASYVEKGHRQTPGRYVPALGVTLKAPWVPGQHMLKTEGERMRGQIQAILDKKMQRFMKEVLG